MIDNTMIERAKRLRIEQRGGIHILVGSDWCQPATAAEIAFWERIAELEAEVERLQRLASSQEQEIAGTVRASPAATPGV